MAKPPLPMQAIETNQHPITPPPELLLQLEAAWFKGNVNVGDLLTTAYQAGADQELEACAAQLSQCCLLTNEQRSTIAEYLHFCRRYRGTTRILIVNKDAAP